MNINEYANKVADEIRAKLGEDYDVRVNEVAKNNDKILHAVVVCEKDACIAPNVYVDGMFERNLSTEEAANEVMRIYEENKEAPQFADISSQFFDWDFVKDKVVMAVVNTARNANLLAETVHREVEDLSIIYKVALDVSGDGVATITIMDSHMKYWGKSVEELHEVAVKNTSNILPYEVKPMSEKIREMFVEDGMPAEMVEMMYPALPQEQEMYIVTNSKMINGAIYMFDNKALDEVADKVGSDLYILPSSIHEVIAISANMTTPARASCLVREVNGSEVSPEEQLSDNVYYYDRENKTVKIA